ncbi:ROK family protein [Rubritalea halochordaticola]
MSERASQESRKPLLAAIEAGGTKFVCAVGYDPFEPLREHRFPTRDPETTMAEAAEFFKQAIADFGEISSMAVGAFGPVDVRPDSEGYGSILTTPKPGWKGTNLIKELRSRIGDSFTVHVDTDVNAAAVGEALYGAARGKRHVAYITVGTGVGGGVLYDGKPLLGILHPEIGHMSVPDLEGSGSGSSSVCPFHECCLEGKASGPAIQSRWGTPGYELPDDHEAWNLEAAYLAHAAVNLTATWAPEIIVFGGGVLQKPGLLEKIREKFSELAGGYWELPDLEEYIQMAELDQKAGIVGTLTLASRMTS